MTYFAAYGTTGFIGMFIASILFSLVIHKTMSTNCTTINELLNPYPFSRIIILVIQLFLLVLYSAMLSAGGEILNSIFNLNKIIGALITALLTTIIISKGYDSVTDLSEVLFLPIVIIIFVISITTTEKAISIPSAAIITPKAVLSPLIYVSYNMLTTIPLLIGIPDKYLYRNCGNHVGIVIFILASMLLLPLYTHYSAIAGSTLPIMSLLSGGIKYLYQILLILAIFSTAVSAAYSLNKSIKTNFHKLSIVLINILAISISLLGFTQIVNKIYFIFGISGIILLIILFTRK